MLKFETDFLTSKAAAGADEMTREDEKQKFEIN